MAINIHISNTFEDASAMTLENLKQNYNDGAHNYVIVPDRFTVSEEDKILHFLNLKSTLNLEIVSFTRLAKLIAKPQLQCLSPQGTVMLLRKVINENKEQLLCYKTACKFANFANDMYAVISQIRNSKISVQNLLSVTDKMDSRTKNKTRDITLLYQKYNEALWQNFADATTVLEGLEQSITMDSVISKCHIYVVDFYKFSNVELSILSKLIEHSLSLDIGIVLLEGENKRLNPRTLREVDNLCKIKNIKPNYYKKTSKLNAQFDNILNNLFCYNSTLKVKSDGKVQVNEYHTVEDEIENIAVQIKKLVVEGMRYKDIALIVAGEQQNLIKKVFADYDIPCFIDEKFILSNQTGFKCISLAMDCVLKSFSQESVFAFLYCGMLKIDDESKKQFENFCKKYNINYNFTKPFNASNNTNESTETQNIDGIEATRAFLINCLQCFSNSNLTVLEHIANIKKFLIAINYDEQMQALADLQIALGFKEYAESTRQTPTKLKEIFDEMQNIVGDDKISFQDFYDILTSVALSIKIAFVPLYRDCVYVGETEESCYDNFQIIFMTNCLEGLVPIESLDNGMLATRENTVWEKCNLFLYPTVRQTNELNRFYLVQLLLKAKRKIILSYSNYNHLGIVTQPSIIIKQINNMFGFVKTERNTVLVEEYANNFATYKNALNKVAVFIGNKQNGVYYDNFEVMDTVYDMLIKHFGVEYVNNMLATQNFCLEEIDDANNLYFNVEKAKEFVSVSKIEKYLSCPFKNFLDNGLCLKQLEKVEFDARNIGNIFHEALEIYFSTVTDFNITNDQVKKIVEDIFDNIIKKDEYIFKLNDEESKIEAKTLKAEIVFAIQKLTEKQRQTNFKPYKCELAFGENCTYPAIKLRVDNGFIYVNGKIDRVDKFEDKIIVIDYKTKQKIDFSLKEIYFGERLQLFLYLKALLNNEKFLPAGCFYLPLTKKYEEENRYKMQGFYCANIDVVKNLDTAFNHNSFPFKSSIFDCNIALSKSNDINFGKQGVSVQDFELICDYVEKIIVKAFKEIKAGYIAPSPTKDACKYCEYSNICQKFTGKISPREFDAISIQNLRGENE
ncbi:MAG: PD-(D/E)XK nuclease family protein [Clostridia bacterium]